MSISYLTRSLTYSYRYTETASHQAQIRRSIHGHTPTLCAGCWTRVCTHDVEACDGSTCTLYLCMTFMCMSAIFGPRFLGCAQYPREHLQARTKLTSTSASHQPCCFRTCFARFWAPLPSLVPLSFDLLHLLFLDAKCDIKLGPDCGHL